MSLDSSPILHNRNFMLLWFGNALSLLGNYGVRIAYPLMVLALSGSPALAGWVTFAVTLPNLVLQIPAGIVADFRNRRRTMLVCQFLGLSATALACAAIVLHPPGLVALLMVTGFVEGAISVFFGLAELGAIRDVVTDGQRPAAFSWYEAEQPVAIMLGRALGGAVFGVARWLPFVANAVSYLVCLSTLSAVPAALMVPKPGVSPDPEPVWSRIREGLRVAWSEPFIRASTLLTGLTNIIFQAVILLIIVGARQDGLPPWVVGVVLASTGIGGVVGSIAASRLIRRYQPKLVYARGLWVWTVLLVPIASSSNPYLLAAAWCGVGAVGTVSSVALTIYRVRTVPDAVLGRVIAAISIVTDGAFSLGGVVAGYLLAFWGVRATGWTLLTLMVGLAVLGGLVARAVPAPVPVAPSVADRGTHVAEGS